MTASKEMGTSVLQTEGTEFANNKHELGSGFSPYLLDENSTLLIP